MIAAPWYLLAAGIGLNILGYLTDGLGGSASKSQRSIHHKMRDEDSGESLNSDRRRSYSQFLTAHYSPIGDKGGSILRIS